MIHEFRTYTCLPGKLPIVLKRFETTTLALFKKHGIRHGPLFTVAIGDDNLQIKYMVEWESYAERDKAWAAFRVDPDWQKALADSEKDGPLIAKMSVEMLVAAAFSVK
jgi:hypothetical protein